MKKVANPLVREIWLAEQDINRITSSMIVVLDPKGSVVELNETSYAILGYAKSEIMGKNWIDNFIPEPRKREVRQLFHDMLSEYTPLDRYEHPVKCRDGNQRIIAWHNLLLRQKSGEISGVLKIGDDITEFRTAREELKVSEQYYRSLFENMTEGFAQCQMVYEDGVPVDWIYLEVNPAFEKITGLKNVVGKNVNSLIPGLRKSNPELFEIYGRVAKTGNPERFESYIRVLDAWFSLSVFSANRGYFVAVFEDITGRKRSEKALRESEQKYSIIFNNAPFPIVLVRLRDRAIVEVNKPWEELFGFSRAEAVGKTTVELGMSTNPKERELIYHELKEKGFVRNMKLTGYLTKGKQNVVLLLNMASLEIRGEYYSLLALQDITEREKTETARKQYSIKLEEANAELQHFVYAVSHDLKEPLRMMTSFAQALQKHLMEPHPRVKEDIDFIVSGAARMQGLLDDLLVYSRVSTQAQPFRNVDMEIVFQDVLTNLKVSVEETGALITHDTLPTIEADRVQMAQVLQNLISNAIKFHRKGERPVVHVSCRKDSEWIFAVKDNGIGIPQELFGRLFSFFSRLNPQDEYPGTGMGLAITKRIVQRHGGRVWVESEPGKGSTFYFTVVLNQTREQTGSKE